MAPTSAIGHFCVEGELQEAFRRRKQEEPVGEIVKRAGSNEPAPCGIFALWKRLVSMMLEASGLNA